MRLALVPIMVAFLGLAPVFAHAEDALQLVGYQFRLIWPATGATSADLISAQAADPVPYLFCGEASFPNGENFHDLGAPYQGLLLVGVHLAEDAATRSASADFTLAEGALPLPVLSGQELTQTLHADRGITRWHPVAILPTGVNLHELAAHFDGNPAPLPSIAWGCAE